MSDTPESLASQGTPPNHWERPEMPVVGDPPPTRSAISLTPLLNPSREDTTNHIYEPKEVEAVGKIREAFLGADRYVIRVGGGGLGDQILQSAYVEGFTHAIHKFRGHKPITLYVEPGLMSIYEDYERYGIKVLPLEVDEKDAALSLNTQINNMDGKVFALDMYGQGFGDFDIFPHFMQYHTAPTGLPNPTSEATVVSNLWQPLIFESYATHDGDRKFAAHLEQILTLGDNALASRDVQPHVPLPAGERRIYREMARRLGIDTNAIQIGGVFQTAQADKAYSIENWRVVMEQVRSSLQDIEPGKSINFNVVLGPVRETWSHVLVESMGEDKIRAVLKDAFADDPRVKINFVELSLEDLKVFLKHQDLVLADDTGPAHIAAHVTGGPEVVSAFLPYKFKKEVWASGSRHHGVSLTEEEFAQFGEGDVRYWDTHGDPVVINTIPPERISQEAMKHLEHRLRHKKSLLGAVGKLFGK